MVNIKKVHPKEKATPKKGVKKKAVAKRGILSRVHPDAGAYDATAPSILDLSPTVLKRDSL